MTAPFDFSAFIDSNSPGDPYGHQNLLPASNEMNNRSYAQLNDQSSNVSNSNFESSIMPPGWLNPTLKNGDGLASSPSVPPYLVGVGMENELPQAAQSNHAFAARPVQQGTRSLGPEGYRAAIAAHHSHLLGSHGATGQKAGASRPRSLNGLRAASSVSQSPNPTNHSGLTLQERRRLSRRIDSERQVGHNSGSGSRSKYSGSSEEGQTSHTSARTGKRRHHRSNRQSSSKGTTLPNSMRPSASSDAHHAAALDHKSEHSMAKSRGDDLYSTSGFDMLGALMRVSARTNPKIALGSVDLSCSFAVSDAKHPENPIVYCSETFTRLTGYEMNEIIGRNCRFLQSPTGSIGKGDPRVHTDAGAVHHLQKHLQLKQECQASFINYRKDGTPFINLVTIIPIGWNDPNDIDFFVGFQVDLLEQPGAILERSSDGLSYVVNYGTSSIPVPPSLVPDATDSDEELQAIMKDELTHLIEGGNNDTKEWSHLLLDNAEDLVYVLSLKGNFLYVSPSSERLLGFKPSEMVGKSISGFCHPSDVVPVYRELKDSTSNTSISAAAKRFTRADGSENPLTRGGSGQSGPRVNLLMRMRHKTAGYVWIESCGKLHLEQGKGRKVVVSSGRCRSVYHLPQERVSRTNQIKEPSFWSKVSKEGLILNSTAPCLDVVGITAHNMSGQHLGQMASGENVPILLEALRGSSAQYFQHEMEDGGGDKVPVVTTVYPSANASSDSRTVFIHTQMLPRRDTSHKKTGSNSMDVDGAMDKGMKAGLGGFFPARPVSINDSNSSLNQLDSDLASELDSSANLFDELSTNNSSSWIFELHQLKNSNKRLRETLRSLNYRSRPANNVQQPATEVNGGSSEENATSSASGGGSTNHHHHQPHQHHSRMTSKGKERATTSNSSEDVNSALDHLHSKSSGSGSGSGSGSNSNSNSNSSNSNSNSASQIFDVHAPGKIPSDDTEMTSDRSSGDELTQAQRDRDFMAQVDAAIKGGPQGPVQDQEALSTKNLKKRKNRD